MLSPAEGCFTKTQFFVYWFVEAVHLLTIMDVHIYFLLRRPFLIVYSLPPQWFTHGKVLGCWSKPPIYERGYVGNYNAKCNFFFQFSIPSITLLSESAPLDSCKVLRRHCRRSQKHTVVWWWKTMLAFAKTTCLIKPVFQATLWQDAWLPCSMCSRILTSSLISLN